MTPTYTSVAALSTASAATYEYEFDYNHAAMVVVATAVGYIPVVGGMLSGLVNILWPPTQHDVWAEIEDQVEALVDEKIDNAVWQDVSATLQGLYNVSANYLNAVHNTPDDTQQIGRDWTYVQNALLEATPQFQRPDWQFLLLPLFAQYVNLFAATYRDGIDFGAEWDFTQSTIDQLKSDLNSKLLEFETYTMGVYDAQLAQVESTAPSNSQKTQPFNTINAFKRQMQLTVLDYVSLWPYYNPYAYPDPAAVDVRLYREIYSDALGTSDDSPFGLPAESPTKPITHITVWGWDRIDAVKVDYADGGGPDGETTTGRMGDSSGGSDAPPHGGSFSIASLGDVNHVKVLSGTILNAMWLDFTGGENTGKLGGNYPGGNESNWSFEGEILSSIKIMGVSNYYGSADCMVLGFMFKDGKVPPPDGDVARALYVSTPAAGSTLSLTARYGMSEAHAAVTQERAKDLAWDAEREAFWSRIAAAAAAFQKG
ncbi:MAG: insecticidal delta-endotoxin Cry8Ea1 family protein [Azospirillaceae bacterium]